ncbi:MAG: site-2 protease family protein [Candidatus Pacebacteria bacterium]|nr:site-2 protease family protein [Candidatus Paceibacterota bacterium]
MSLTAIILFIIILLVLVIVHEFGHFIVAKLTNMRVDEFAFGFPPRIFSKKIGETTYAVNALPLGGYVSILGENGDEEDPVNKANKANPRAFSNRPWWAQLLVLVAGVTMNMLLAWFIFIGISYGDITMSTRDEKYGSLVKNPSLMVIDAAPESPAYKAGIIPGSTLVSITSKGTVAQLTNENSLITFIEKHANDPLRISYKHPSGDIKETTVAAIYGIVPNKKAIGISVENVGTLHTTFIQAITIGTEKTIEITRMTFEGLGTLVTSVIKGDNVLNSLSGPVGIAKIVGQTSEYGYSAVLTLIAVLSINLAIFNILPLPALDGGRMVVVIIETVIRKRIPFKYYSWANIIGFSLLMLLLIIVTVHDIRR